MTAIDATGLGAFGDLADQLQESGRTLLLCGAREQPAKLMRQADFERHVGSENICDSINDALERAAEVYQTIHSPAAREQQEKEELASKI
jgi:SulP family sulfate permease